ncbi:hypothetical protein [Ralstonia insidiosa]|uniref:Uncharacterized protein n=1 Tax=Ralstonia insidiosa TaxID=190721 RepID=A0A848NX28_9RALS|nr:hypothetical protein [Ralstonia insidiosa]NMV39861.1 hypothetical protein [Ralstonia insidiosa]
MQVNVTALRMRGVEKQKWMRWMGQVRGELVIGECRDTLNKCTTLVAELKNNDDPQRRRWLLFDCRLAWMKGGTIVLRGYERHVEWNQVATDYAQTWLVHVQAGGVESMRPPSADGSMMADLEPDGDDDVQRLHPVEAGGGG